MPRYFFNVDDRHCIPDFEGTELSGIDAARGEACRRSEALIADEPLAFAAGGPWQMGVSDEWGILMFWHPFAAKPGRKDAA